MLVGRKGKTPENPKFISRACEAIGGRDPEVVDLSATELPYLVTRFAYLKSARRLACPLGTTP